MRTHHRDTVPGVALRRNDTPPERLPLSDADARADAALSASSVRLSRARIGGALSIRCSEHDAAAGEYCWRNPRSGVRGFCHDRFVRGLAMRPRPLRTVPDELAEIAQAARYAQRDARLRLTGVSR